MILATDLTSLERSRPGNSGNSPSPREPLHVLTLTPFFPYVANPVYGTYISEPIEHFGEFGLHSTVIGVSAFHHSRRGSLAESPATWMRYPTLPGNSGLTSAGNLLSCRVLPFVQHLHQYNPVHVIHAHSTLPCGHAASLLSERLQVPFVVTVHGLDVFNSCFAHGTHAANRRQELSIRVYERAASVICVSGAIQGILRQRLPQCRACVIHNGVDPELFSPQIVRDLAGTTKTEVSDNSNRPQTVLIVGNLLRSKGHEVVLRALSRILPQFPNLRCSIVGEGPDHRLFAELASSLGIADHVTFCGRLSRQAVAAAMRECTIFALPSRWEGLGCAYLEAMASAKPVIACEGQGIADVIDHGKNGWLIPIDDVPKMTEALLQLLGSPDLRTHIGANARQTILNGFTLADQVRELAHIYHVVGDRHPLKAPARTA